MRSRRTGTRPKGEAIEARLRCSQLVSDTFFARIRPHSGPRLVGCGSGGHFRRGHTRDLRRAVRAEAALGPKRSVGEERLGQGLEGLT